METVEHVLCVYQLRGEGLRLLSSLHFATSIYRSIATTREDEGHTKRYSRNLSSFWFCNLSIQNVGLISKSPIFLPIPEFSAASISLPTSRSSRCCGMARIDICAVRSGSAGIRLPEAPRRTSS